MTEATTADLMDAARAAGLDVRWLPIECHFTVMVDDEDTGVVWQPLHNADQRELLAEKCDLSVHRFGEFGGAVAYFDHEHMATTQVHWQSMAPDFSDAIVIAAARYWRARNA